MRKRLTEEAVKRLKPPAAGKAVVYDAVVSGLLFVVNSGGSKSWMALTYRQAVAKSGKNAGKEITMPSAHRLGRYPIMDLKHAREAARAFLTNPNKVADGGTIGEVAASFRHGVIANKLRSASKIERRNGADSRRSRILEDDEIRVLRKVSGELGAYGALLKVLLLTAQRCDKVLTMNWAHIVDNVWLIRTERREKGNAGTLVLPQVVLELIEQQPRITGNPRVFATAGSMASRKQDLDRRLKAALGEMAPWVLGDLRRTARSLMARAGVPRDHAERVLGHSRPGVEGVYDQHHYTTEKASALRALAGLVAEIVQVRPGRRVSHGRRSRSLSEY